MVLRREVRALEQLLDDHLRDLGHRGAEIEGDVDHHAQRGVPRRLMLGELHLADDLLLLLVQLCHELHLLIHHLVDVRLPLIHLRRREARQLSSCSLRPSLLTAQMEPRVTAAMCHILTGPRRMHGHVHALGGMCVRAHLIL